MKKIFTILILLPVICFSQTTNTPIKGFSIFNLGDSISKLESYNYNFRELTIPKDFDYSDKNNYVDSFKNFCNDSRVFFSNDFKIEDYEYNNGVVLTYYHGHLIDVRIMGTGLAEDKLKDIFILKYGTRYKKIFLKGYYYNKALYEKKYKKITQSQEKYLQEQFLSSIEWGNNGNIFSFGISNPTYDFCKKIYKETNLSSDGVAVTNLREYSKLISCSNNNYKKNYDIFLENLKSKTANY